MARNPIAGLLTPFHSANLDLSNHVVMAPMTRSFSPGGVPGDDVVAYYARRAEAGVSFIVTEGAFIPCAPTVPVTRRITFKAAMPRSPSSTDCRIS